MKTLHLIRKATAMLLILVMVMTCISAWATDETTTQTVNSGDDKTIDGAVIIEVTTAEKAVGVVVDASGSEDASLTVTKFIDAEREEPAAPGWSAEGAQVFAENGNTAELTVGEEIQTKTEVENSWVNAVVAEAEDPGSKAIVTSEGISAETEKDYSSATALNATAEDGSGVTVETGNISTETEGYQSSATAIKIKAEDESSVTVETSNISTETEGARSSATALNATAEDGSSVSVITGDISAETEGSQSIAAAINAKAEDGSNVTVETGKISAEAEGPKSNAMAINVQADDASISVNAKGDITASANDGLAYSIEVSTIDDNSSIDITAKGGVSAESQSSNAVGAYLHGQGGSISVEVENDLTSSWSGVKINDNNYKYEAMTSADTAAVVGKGKSINTYTVGTDTFEVFRYEDENGVAYNYTLKNGVYDYGDKYIPVEKPTDYTVDVKGIISAESKKGSVEAITADLKVSGDTAKISATGISGKTEADAIASAIMIYDAEDTEFTLTVGEKGITAISEGKNNGNARGVDTSVKGTQTMNIDGDIQVESHGNTSWNTAGFAADITDTGSLTVHVGGGISAATNGEHSNSTGMNLNLAGGEADIKIDKDVTAESAGVRVSQNRKAEIAQLTTQAEAEAALKSFPDDVKPSEQTRVIDGVLTSVLQYNYYDGNVSYSITTLKDGTLLQGSKTEYSDPEANAKILIDGNVVTEGRVEGSSSIAVYAGGNNTEAETEITVKGNAQAAGEGSASAVNTIADKGTIKVRVGGDISAIAKDGSATGIIARAGGAAEGEAQVIAEGSVSVSSGSDNPNMRVAGVDAQVNGENGKVTITVADGITSENTANTELAKGVNMTSYTDQENKAGTIDVEVTNDIQSTGTGIAISGTEREFIEGNAEIKESEYVRSEYRTDVTGELYEEKIYYNAEGDYYYNDYGTMWKTQEVESGLTRIEVKGDVTAGNIGLDVSGEVPADVIIDGTLSGDNHAVVLSQETVADNLTLTVWEIKPNEDGSVAEYGQIDENGELQTTEATDVEKEIQYIIRLEQPQAGGTIYTEGTFEYEGYTVAHESDTVILKVNLQPGYEIVDAYNGTDTKVSLLKDADGNYYLVVPRGGAVLLSVKLRKSETETKKQTNAAQQVTITMDPNGGTLRGSTEPIVESAKKGQYVKLPEEPTKEGETFLGWYGTEYPATDAQWSAPEEGSTELLKAETKVKVTQDCFYTAVWKKAE